MRNRETSWAAVSEPPPRSKKSSLTLSGPVPRIDCQSSAIHASVSVKTPWPEPVLGSGHGSASRSILPEVLVGRESTTASRGTIAAGIASRRAAVEAFRSKPSVTVT